ncbi:MAG: hypothetical protein JRJ44_04105 [Deltaproteobacteria bacterium]|nr:hypothetical protein [Deltaproteobacteria bacterium]
MKDTDVIAYEQTEFEGIKEKNIKALHKLIDPEETKKDIAGRQAGGATIAISYAFAF